MNRYRICAVVVTYNRKEYLCKLLEGLFNQSYKLDAIFIFDNCSSDGTDTLLLEKGFVNGTNSMELNAKSVQEIDIFYYRNNENTGGSGGFHDAMDMVSKMDYDYLWAMDDDVLPDNGCLENLIKWMAEDVRICIPTRTDTNYVDRAIVNVNMSNPFCYTIKKRKSFVENKDIKGECLEIKDMPFEGPLIANSLIKEIGLPRKDLFIIFDDSEYAYRAQKVTKLLYVKNAVLHKQIIPKRDRAQLMGWKEYYGYRNQIWFDITYGENVFVKKLRPIFLIFDLSCRAIVRKKWSNFRVLKKAFEDGTNKRLGKLVQPGTTGKNFK